VAQSVDTELKKKKKKQERFTFYVQKGLGIISNSLLLLSGLKKTGKTQGGAEASKVSQTEVTISPWKALHTQ
jgi:hypothetical protein